MIEMSREGIECKMDYAASVNKNMPHIVIVATQKDETKRANAYIWRCLLKTMIT